MPLSTEALTPGSLHHPQLRLTQSAIEEGPTRGTRATDPQEAEVPVAAQAAHQAEARAVEESRSSGANGAIIVAPKTTLVKAAKSSRLLWPRPMWGNPKANGNRPLDTKALLAELEMQPKPPRNQSQENLAASPQVTTRRVNSPTFPTVKGLARLSWFVL